jgi:hypothetical protein
MARERLPHLQARLGIDGQNHRGDDDTTAISSGLGALHHVAQS